MADVHDIKTRSYNMSQIKSRDTKPEILVRKFLFRQGCRYRLHDKKLLGKPDIVLPKYKTVIFVHGCFWHGCPYCNPPMPKSNTDFWTNKFEKNQERDQKKLDQLMEAGRTPLIILECQLKSNCIKYVKKIKRNLNEIEA